MMDKVFWDIFRELLASRDQCIILFSIFALGIAIGVTLTGLYFIKIRYYCLKKELAKAENELDKYKVESEDLRVRLNNLQNFRDEEYVRLGMSYDSVPLPPDQD